MANDEHVEMLKKGAEAWNKWRSENPNGQTIHRVANLGGDALDELPAAKNSVATAG
jgi:hypothetical protein